MYNNNRKLFVILVEIDYINSMKTYTLKLNTQALEALKSKYKGFDFRYDIQHTLYQIKGSDVTITAYKSGKVVIQGEGALFHAQALGYVDAEEIILEANATIPNELPMAGSDEVGTGDYFGPVVVCAALVTEDDLLKIPVYDIMDSKQMTDTLICKVAPQLMNVLKYSVLVVDNRKYNQQHQKYNMNTIKALLHNQTYLNLQKKTSIPRLAVVDQFMTKANYFKALKDAPEVYQDLTFATKAESQYIAVACASIIARYKFIEYFEMLSEKYQFNFPKGAGPKVDQKGVEFVQRFGSEALNDVAKTHFANTSKILNLL